MPPLAPPAAPGFSADGPLVVLGDTQRTSWGETLLFDREQNEAARRSLIAKLAAEERPAFVVHLGDLVTVGDSREEWEYFDRLLSPLTARRIPVLPILGNHDHWGDRREALRHARRRFPQLVNDGFYAMRHRRLGLVWLNSNLEGASGREQAVWFEGALAAFEREPGVAGVLVFTHHPPYTNGEQRHGDGYVISEILPAFFRSRKAVVMMSGHVHGYERFHAEGRTFVVTGGAGGPRVRYRIGADASHTPAYATPTGEVRAFNYVVVEDAGASLRLTVKCLMPGGGCVRGLLETFLVELPATG